MLRLNGRQLLGAVTLLIFLVMLGERLYVLSVSETVMAYRVAGSPENPYMEYEQNGATKNFKPHEFTITNLEYNEYIPACISPGGDRKPFIKSFSGIFGERIFYFCVIVFAWLLLGSAILTKNEELLIGKGWLKERKRTTTGTTGTSRLPAVRKKSRNFKND